MIRVITPGAMTTVQDGGRPHCRPMGIPASGAMDGRAAALANLLAGNHRHTALLECTFLGPELELGRDCAVAVTGGVSALFVNGTPAPLWQTLPLRRGDTLRPGPITRGCRQYIAFSGGLAVPAVLGSRSTCVRLGLGGHLGRPLRAGDTLPLGEAAAPPIHRLEPGEIPHYGGGYTLRVVPGPQHNRFTEAGLRTFLGEPYTVGGGGDRMGLRLEGPVVETVAGSDIVSDGILPGAVQVPGDGRPILLMADSQTTGGYAKIAAVITADLPLAAQARPGETLRFRAVGLEEAHRALREWEGTLRRLELARAAAESKARRFTVTVDGAPYDVTVQEAETI